MKIKETYNETYIVEYKTNEIPPIEEMMSEVERTNNKVRIEVKSKGFKVWDMKY